MYEFQLRKLQKMVSKGIKETFKTSEGHFRVSSTCCLGGQFDEGRTLHGFRINNLKITLILNLSWVW